MPPVSALRFCGLAVCLVAMTGCIKESEASQPLSGLRAAEVKYVDVWCPMLTTHVHVKPAVGSRHGDALRVTNENAIQRLVDRSLYTDAPPQPTSGLNDFRVTFYRRQP